jgi:hypothetical protein
MITAPLGFPAIKSGACFLYGTLQDTPSCVPVSTETGTRYNAGTCLFKVKSAMHLGGIVAW